jgi:RNA polymerase sigma-70 factor (ECF subfamily)
VDIELVDRVRAGDEEAFRQLVEPHWRELRLHCYRILGSMHDAEDALQDTLLAAWQGLGVFEGRSSLRTWLYRIATTRSLNTARARRRRVGPAQRSLEGDLPQPNQLNEVTWLEPCPDDFIESFADSAAGPDARYEAREAVSLAFVTALQLLPPRQRAVLILRDVLGFHAREVADILECTEESVTSALKRARATFHRQLPSGDLEPAPAPRSRAERELVERFTEAFLASDVDGIVALLTEDVRFAMPPLPFLWLGRDLAARFMRAIMVSQDLQPRLVATRANGQPAFALYVLDPEFGRHRAMGLLMLSLTGRAVRGITRFETRVLSRFGLELEPNLAI